MKKELVGLKANERLELLEDKLRMLSNVKNVKLAPPPYLNGNDEIVMHLLVEIECFLEPLNGLKQYVWELCADYGFAGAQVELHDPTPRDSMGNPITFNP